MTPSDFEQTRESYDALAQSYRQAKTLPFVEYVLRHSLLRLAGGLEGKSVLDLGCGEGHNTRLAKQAGAERVLGVDISREMINLAEEIERALPLGCRYQVADVADLALKDSFDLVLGVFLLNYAADRAQLLSLCQTIARALRPGGRFVGLNTNMALDPSHYDDCRKYGRWMTTTAARAEGDVIAVHLGDPDGDAVRLENHYLSPATYESAFAEAGLREFGWHGPWVSQVGIEAFAPGYWEAFLAAPPVIGLQAVK
ncbi:MAG: methyltransferase domain-containing protein [Pseudomonadota bacterium]